MLADDESDRGEGQWDDIEAEKPEHQRGFRHWMDLNEESLRVISLVGAYAIGIIYLISLVVFENRRIILEILEGLFLVCLAVAYFLFRVGLRRDRKGRTLWQRYRRPSTERTESIVAAILWLFIGIGFLSVLIYTRTHH